MSKAVALAVLAATLLAAPAGAGASGAVTVVLTGTSKDNPGRACGVAASFAQYRVRGYVLFKGNTGMRGVRSVRVVVRRCSGTSFGIVKTLSVRSGADGRFRGRFQVHVRSDCYLQTFVGKKASNRAFFVVR